MKKNRKGEATASMGNLFRSDSVRLLRPYFACRLAGGLAMTNQPSKEAQT
jgi:hypothetical protein